MRDGGREGERVREVGKEEREGEGIDMGEREMGRERE